MSCFEFAAVSLDSRLSSVSTAELVLSDKDHTVIFTGLLALLAGQKLQSVFRRVAAIFKSLRRSSSE